MLLDEKGSEVETSVGPYNVGGTLILTCDILGGENIKNLYSAKWYNSEKEAYLYTFDTFSRKEICIQLNDKRNYFAVQYRQLT